MPTNREQRSESEAQFQQYVNEHLSSAGVTSVPEPIELCSHHRPHLRRPKGECPSDGFPAWSTPRLPRGLQRLLRGHRVDKVPLASVEKRMG